MPHYVQHGSIITQTPEADMVVHDRLPVGTYTIGFNPMNGYFFSAIEPLTVPSRIYGDHSKVAERIMNTTLDRLKNGQSSTGVLLSGEKGSGKTMISKLISANATRMGWPTVVINQPHCGEAFNDFMGTFAQPAVIIFDEFEKVYDKGDQQRLLTLLDGVYASDKLFIFTANDRFKLDEHMKNRPGRIYYAIEFEGLADDFVREYGEENLARKSHVDQLVQVAAMFWRFNFDALQAIVQECNRYDESPVKTLKFLNADVMNEERGQYDVTITKDGVELASRNPIYNGSPINLDDDSWRVYPKGEMFDPQLHSEYVTFYEDDFSGYSQGVFTFRNDEGYILSLRRHIERRMGFESLEDIPLSLIA